MIALVTAIAAVTGCSSGSGSGGTGLESALARVADTANNRSMIDYDNTAALVQVAGKSLTSLKGFAELRGWGVPGIVTSYVAPGDFGLNLFGEDYGISAGSPPRSVSLMAGGQSSSQVTSDLTRQGWKRSGGRLVGPSPFSASVTNAAGTLALQAAQVQPSGSDVVFGESGGDLSQIGSPQGATLAGDPLIGALAQCLGNVVAASIYVGTYQGGQRPVAVAIGVTQPASNTATAHAVACVSWSSQAKAASYVTDLRKALSGLDAMTDEPYSKVLTHATVTNVGGGQHVVEWQADTPQSATTVFTMVNAAALPALIDCSRMTRAAAATIPGCLT